MKVCNPVPSNQLLSAMNFVTYEPVHLYQPDPYHQFVNSYLATVNVFLTPFIISSQVPPIAITGAIMVNK